MFYKKTLEKLIDGHNKNYQSIRQIEKTMDIFRSEIDHLLKQKELWIKLANQTVNKIKELEENFLKNTKTLFQMEKAINTIKTTKKAKK